MISVIASIQVKDGQLDNFIEIFKSNMPAVLKEKGCIEYIPTVDVPTELPPQELNKNIVTVIEKWQSVEDLMAHLSSAHMLEYKEKTKDIVASMTVKVLTEV
ncbi:putative quinol monooxygenase [uncultured Desulfobacter sp.]|uniref:putative quinol monooxygenase n=1 Tax=uncultured Desulfobacter sp. TaxID=240139 RepID=UPI002AA8952F|nr:putative quinol monooxygenase [uncultured Desulfobacter sp.]